VERLTTGRRHIRAGSVHVSELIGHRPELFDLPIPTQAESPDGVLDILLEPDPEAPCSHRKPPSKAVQAAKIAVLGVASCVLCAAIAYGSMVTHRSDQAQPDQARPNVRPAADISGERALLPDRLDRAVPQAGIATAELPGPETNASDTIDNPGPTPQAGQPADPTARPADAPPTDDTVSKTELVKQFYRLAPSFPAKAFSLLDPNLLGMDVTTFTQSWSTVTGLEILDVQERGDDVLAVVRMRLPDGSHLRVQQLLDVANTVPRRIVGAEILSAQRS
jgi:hypothetical protein